MKLTILAKRLKKLRSTSGLSQREFARLFNMSPSTLAMYETGRREPDYNILSKLADYYNVSTDYLLGRTDNPYPYDENNENKQPDFSTAFKEKNLGDAITRIVNICEEFSLSKQIMMEMFDKAIDVYGLPGGEGGVAAHGPNYPGSGSLDRNGDDN